MSRRIVRELKRTITDLETELEHVTRDRARLIAMTFWEEATCRTQQNDS